MPFVNQPVASAPNQRTTRCKVLFVVHGLDGGGAERVVVRLLSFLDRERFEPVLLVFRKVGPYVPYVPGDVRILDCGRYKSGARRWWFCRFLRFLKAERQDVVISFAWFSNAMTVLARALSSPHSRLVVSERVTLSGAREGFITEAVRRAAMALLYRFADRIVPNSQALADQLIRSLRLPRAKVVALPNPIDVDDILARSKEPAPVQGTAPPLIVAMGRLTSQKGFDLLLRAVALLRRPCRVAFLGDGPALGRLQALASELGVAERVQFAGFLENPYPLLASATAFALPSRYEGFPNALLEAMALGLPCVASRCPTGPEEIVTDGADGLLVPIEDHVALAEALGRLLSDEALRARLGVAAAKRARDFDAPVVVRRFEALLDEVAG